VTYALGGVSFVSVGGAVPVSIVVAGAPPISFGAARLRGRRRLGRRLQRAPPKEVLHVGIDFDAVTRGADEASWIDDETAAVEIDIAGWGPGVLPTLHLIAGNQHRSGEMMCT
jgi:hypothetical protein